MALSIRHAWGALFKNYTRVSLSIALSTVQSHFSDFCFTGTRSDAQSIVQASVCYSRHTGTYATVGGLRTISGISKKSRFSLENLGATFVLPRTV